MAKKRFQETVNIQPTDMRTGQAQGLMSLSDRLQEFKSLGSQMTQAGFKHVEQKQIKQGTEAGLAEQIQRTPEGKLIQPEEAQAGLFNRAEINAFNAAQQAAYMASLDNDNRAALTDIYNQNSSNVLKYNDAITAYTKGVVQGVDQSIKGRVAIDLNNTASLYRQKVQTNQYKKQQEAAKIEIVSNTKSANEAALREARNGDIRLSGENMLKAFTSLQSGVNAGFWTQAEADEQKKTIDRDATEQRYLGNVDIMANESIPAAYDAIDRLSQKVPKGFTPDQWRSAITEAHQNVSRKRQEKQNQLKELKKRLLKQESIQRGLEFLNPDVPADPKRGGQDRKDVNAAYGHLVETQKWRDLPTFEQFEKNAWFMKNTGLMPDALISDVSAVMRSGNEDQIELNSMLVDRVTKEPNGSIILKDLPAESKAVSRQIADLRNAGVGTEQAMEIARKNVYGLTQTEKEVLRDKIREVSPDLPKMLANLTDRHVSKGGYDPSRWPFMGEEPDVTPAFQADFDVAFRNYMLFTNANTEQSKELAFQALGTKWGVWQGEFKKYSPDRAYGVPGIDDDWIEDQYKTDMASLAKIDPALKGLDTEKTILSVDFEAANSDRPEWPIFYIDAEDKQLKPLRVKGVNQKWKPDFTATREYKKLRASEQSKQKRIMSTTLGLREKIKQLDAELYIDPMGRDTRKNKGAK